MDWPNVHLELLGQTGWWIAVGVMVGVALVVYGVMGWRRGTPPGAVVPQGIQPEAGVPRVWGISLPVAAVGAGVGAIVLTGVLAWSSGWPWRSDAPNASVPVFLMVILAAAVILFYRGVYGTLTRFRRGVLIGLRIFGMGALVLLLFRPVLALVAGPSSGKPLVSIVVDASASMGYNDAPNQPNRYRQSAIAIESTLAPRLEKSYRVQVYAYDGKHQTPLASPEELDTIAPDGQVTDLGAAVGMTIGDEVTSAAPIATVLFSDGIHNGPVAVDTELSRFGTAVPVHTVRVGSSELEPSSVPDIAVVSVDGPQTAIVNNQVTLTATIKSTAMSDRTIRVILSNKDAPAGTRPLEEQRLVLHSGSVPQTVQFKFTPEKVGRAVVRVQVPVDPDERSDVNNQQDFALLVTDPKLSVLYVEGRVRPEVGPLRRTLEQDANIAAVSIVQTAAGRFEMTGLKPGDELQGLPTTLAQWKRFKVIVLGDLDASFISTQQQKDLEQVVRDGAGLLMIGGSNSFAPGGWDKTTLSSILPVTLEKETPAQINAPFVPELTAMGAGHPIFRNIAGYFLDATGKPAGTVTVPELSGCVALGSAKAGATVLAVHPKEKVNGNAAIVLAVQQYGKGRSAAFAADTTWRWSLALRALQKESPYNRFWGQMIRWLASEENLEKKSGASVTAMLTKERFESGEAVMLRAAVTDKDGQATNFAKVSAEITTPDNKTTQVPLTPRGEEAGQIGIYESSAYKPALAGTYKVVFSANKDNGDLGKDQSTFLVMPAAGERDVLAAQPRTLETISRLTGGSSIDISAVDALADRLLASAPAPPAALVTTVPLSRPRPFFLLFIGALATEWMLRRRWQLQ